MTRRTDFVGGGKYTAPMCEVVAVRTEKGMCVTAVHEGFEDGDEVDW